MRALRLLGVSLAIAGMALLASGADAPSLGVAGWLPGSLALQLTFAEGFAVEAGVAATGPGVFAAKVYLAPWELGAVSLVPVLGLGGAVAFLPGDLIAWGAYALAGLEVPIPETSLHLMADLAVILPLPPGTGTFFIAPRIGLRLDFW